MGSKEVQFHGTLVITVPQGEDAALEDMLRLAAEHGAVLQATVLRLAFSGNPEMQRRWFAFVQDAEVEFELHFDPILGNLSGQDRQVIDEFVYTRGGAVFLDVRRANTRNRLQRLVRAVTSEDVQQTALALRKLVGIKGFYAEQLWLGDRVLNLTRLYELLTAADNSGIRAAIKKISDMSDTRVEYLRAFAVACKQRGVI